MGWILDNLSAVFFHYIVIITQLHSWYLLIPVLFCLIMEWQNIIFFHNWSLHNYHLRNRHSFLPFNLIWLNKDLKTAALCFWLICHIGNGTSIIEHCIVGYSIHRSVECYMLHILANVCCPVALCSSCLTML